MTYNAVFITAFLKSIWLLLDPSGRSDFKYLVPAVTTFSKSINLFVWIDSPHVMSLLRSAVGNPCRGCQHRWLSACMNSAKRRVLPRFPMQASSVEHDAAGVKWQAASVNTQTHKHTNINTQTRTPCAFLSSFLSTRAHTHSLKPAMYTHTLV